MDTVRQMDQCEQHFLALAETKQQLDKAENTEGVTKYKMMGLCVCHRVVLATIQGETSERRGCLRLHCFQEVEWH